MRPRWRKGKPKHKMSGFSEVVIVILNNGNITPDRYFYHNEQWEKNHRNVKGWFYLPKGNYSNDTPWIRFIKSCTGKGYNQ